MKCMTGTDTSAAIDLITGASAIETLTARLNDPTPTIADEGL
jgi:hypothetical protein